jgi:hypothetical protein
MKMEGSLPSVLISDNKKVKVNRNIEISIPKQRACYPLRRAHPGKMHL